MKKNDYIIVALLVGLMFIWMKFFPILERKFFPRPEQPVAPVATANTDASASAPSSESDAALVEKIAPLPTLEESVTPEQRLTLSNDSIELSISSRGGTVVSALLKEYPALNEENSTPVLLDFESAPALRYDGLVTSGTLEVTTSGLRYTASLGDGRILVRTLTLQEGYQLAIEDSFINRMDSTWDLQKLRLSTGPMSDAIGTSSMAGLETLGVDTLDAIDGVKHHSKTFNKLFKQVAKDTKLLTTTPAMIPQQPVSWIAAKNKFFVQILTPETATQGFDITIRREGEGKKLLPVEVTAALQFDTERIAAGQSLIKKTRVYIGPKEFSLLKKQGFEQSEIMEFKSQGFWKFMNPIMYPTKTGLLWGLNGLNSLVHNYGVAIILLTIIIRILLWPVTHKGTESMRRMQALQPQLKALQVQFKDSPQRLQQETMKFYKENKVNPMGGCLPVLIQIPVFIALFAVLRSTIELRFSQFLWVSDLSEPENLFAGMIPMIGSLNILPLIMTATTIWQMKVTPSTGGDPQQQKMMMVMMPIMMLVFMYTMPSGLVLYMTTSNVISIAQMMVKKVKPA